jgi:adenosylhomocysteine nucleosidase
LAQVGLITALDREARCLGTLGDSVISVTSGPGPAHARGTAERLLTQGCDALISFGVAGGLDPALTPGTLILATEIVPPTGPALATDTEWRHRLAAQFTDRLSFVECPLAGVDKVLASVADKQESFYATGAGAVDMESHAIAASAQAAGVPFIALRAIADPARRSLPQAALRAVGRSGETRTMSVLGGLLTRPWEIVALLALSRDSGKAFKTLRRVAVLAGSGFAFR